jgi:hypothetical protein
MVTSTAHDVSEERTAPRLRRARLDLSCFADRRFLAMAPMVLVGLAIPFLARAMEPLWIDATPVAQTRMFVRLCMSFLLLGCFPSVLVLVRLGITDVTASLHRRTLGAYSALTTSWQCLVGLDGVLLVAWPARVSLPNFAFDVALSVFSVASIPFVLHQQAWFYGFDVGKLARARQALAGAPSIENARTPLDTLDYRVLQLVSRSGSDIANVMINDMGIGYRDLMLRLSKLVALGYVSLVEEMHGPQVVLTTLATDTLALPVSLFTWDTDDKETLAALATARLSLEGREPQKVVVACARLCETMLKKSIARIEPKVTHVGGKEIGKATLGELVGTCRQHKLIGRFEDSVFSAINERRKKIHAREGEAPIDDQDAFVIYTLTEIVAREVLRRGKAGGGDFVD